MPQISDDVQAAVVADYRSNVPVQQIMDSHGIGEQALYRTLRAAGVKASRPFAGRRKQDWSKAELERIRKLRADGASVTAIRRLFGAGDERVKRALKQLDLD